MLLNSVINNRSLLLHFHRIRLLLFHCFMLMQARNTRIRLSQVVMDTNFALSANAYSGLVILDSLL